MDQKHTGASQTDTKSRIQDLILKKLKKHYTKNMP